MFSFLKKLPLGLSILNSVRVYRSANPKSNRSSPKPPSCSRASCLRIVQGRAVSFPNLGVAEDNICFDFLPILCHPF